MERGDNRLYPRDLFAEFLLSGSVLYLRFRKYFHRDAWNQQLDESSDNLYSSDSDDYISRYGQAVESRYLIRSRALAIHQSPPSSGDIATRASLNDLRMTGFLMGFAVASRIIPCPDCSAYEPAQECYGQVVLLSAGHGYPP